MRLICGNVPCFFALEETKGYLVQLGGYPAFKVHPHGFPCGTPLGAEPFRF